VTGGDADEGPVRGDPRTGPPTSERLPLERQARLVLEDAAQQHDEVHERPHAGAAERHDHQDARADLAGVEPVDPERAEEEAQQRRDEQVLRAGGGGGGRGDRRRGGVGLGHRSSVVGTARRRAVVSRRR
jgi:hypothetical protein